MANFSEARATESTDGARPGLTRNSAPARRHDSACSSVVTVPAPTRTLSRYCCATSRITVTALGTVMVISTMGMPPAEIASTARVASSTDVARTTGMIPTSSILRITSSMVIDFLFLALDAGSARLHGLQYLRQRSHGCVARRGHG